MALRREGVDTIFTLAGDHVLPLLDVMSDAGFRFIDTRHEQGAVHMADAWGRITGGPGVAMYTTPGFANAIPGLSNALHTESPLLSISGSAPLPELGRGAMQEIDQVGMAQPATKASWMVNDVRRIPQMVSQALRVAYAGRRGPVHLTIPIDLQEQTVSEDDVSFQGAGFKGARPAPGDQGLIEEAVAVLRTATRPLIIAGTAAAYSDFGEALQRLAETTRIPLMTEGDARGLLPDDHPNSAGFFDNGLNRAARLSGNADAVLLLGKKQDIILGYAMPPTIGQDAALVQVDPSAEEIGRNRSATVGIVGDVATVVDQLATEASRHSWTEPVWAAELQAEREAQRQWLETLATDEVPMHAMKVHKVLESFLRPDDCLVFDGGDYCHFGRAFHPARLPRRWFYVSPLGMLGIGLPTALAAKVAHPNRRVFLLTGDGGFGFNGMEYDTAVRHGLNVVGILGNDAAWGIDRQIQLGVYGKPVATDLLPARYDRMVAGLGGYGEHVEQPGELAGAIERALSSGLPALLNVTVQRAISPRAEAAVARWKSRSIQPF
jgi:acetolactate synthase-1/2/3 large subunit